MNIQFAGARARRIRGHFRMLSRSLSQRGAITRLAEAYATDEDTILLICRELIAPEDYWQWRKNKPRPGEEEAE